MEADLRSQPGSAAGSGSDLPWPGIAYPVTHSALGAGQGRFDANGPIPYVQHKGQPMGQCTFGVARAGGGYATAVVTKPDGRSAPFALDPVRRQWARDEYVTAE